MKWLKVINRDQCKIVFWKYRLKKFLKMLACFGLPSDRCSDIENTVKTPTCFGPPNNSYDSWKFVYPFNELGDAIYESKAQKP